jgi:hypothetical protein
MWNTNLPLKKSKEQNFRSTKKLNTEEQKITIAEQKYKYMWNTNLPMKDH